MCIDRNYSKVPRCGSGRCRVSNDIFDGCVCKIDNQTGCGDVSWDIYDPQVDSSGKRISNIKICDCIFLCRCEKESRCCILVEILCGTITVSEAKDKKRQIESCIDLVLGEGCKVIKSYIFYSKEDGHHFQRKALSKILSHGPNEYGGVKIIYEKFK